MQTLEVHGELYSGDAEGREMAAYGGCAPWLKRRLERLQNVRKV